MLQKSKPRLLQTTILTAKESPQWISPEKDPWGTSRRPEVPSPCCPQVSSVAFSRSPQISVPSFLICAWDFWYTGNLLKNTPSPLSTGRLLSKSAWVLYYYHHTSINSSYLIFCCLSFWGHRLWYLNYCLDWQEAISSAASDGSLRSSNKKPFPFDKPLVV